MKQNSGQEHWYGPLVKAEHKVGEALVSAEQKVEKAISHDVDHTIQDLDRVEKKFNQFGRVHPRVLWWVEVLAFIGFIAAMLVAQVHFNQSKMLP